MEIFNHVISDDQIIGVAPLFLKRNSTPFNVVQLRFDIYLKNYAITIESDWFEVDEVNKDHETEKQKYKVFREKYFTIAAKIKSIIDPNDQTSNDTTE